jgi:hypothetical protein
MRYFSLLILGMFSSSGARAAYQCLNCPPGAYADAGSTGACITCPANYYCPGATIRIACPAGTTSAAGAMSKNDCRIVQIPSAPATGGCTATNPVVKVDGEFLKNYDTRGIDYSLWTCSSVGNSAAATVTNLGNCGPGKYCYCRLHGSNGWSDKWIMMAAIATDTGCASVCSTHCDFTRQTYNPQYIWQNYVDVAW